MPSGIHHARGVARKATNTYAAAGVDIDAADDAMDRIGPVVRRTFGPRVFADHGGFAGAFRLDYDEKLFKRNYREPVLVSCTDGVGSKVLIAAAMKRYDTVGIDLVAMSVNDLLTTGAEPLFFLDYLALNKLEPAIVEQLVSGVAAGCEQSGCALLGGETAEMPDLYAAGHFDLAGFAVGVAERRRLMSAKNVKPGDAVIGLASSGLHSNGYALARRLLLKSARLKLSDAPRALGETLGDALLRPTRIYVKSVLEVLGRYASRSPVTGMAHITGGGLPGNLPRVIPPTKDISLRRGTWPIPPIFGLLEHHGVQESEMYRVFNMGIGYAMIVRPRSAAAIIRQLERSGQSAFLIGSVKSGKGRVELR
ncbi:MAG: phosphoribosylformylglycinamidine cyclo-ligase [Phycisphaerales bacterium]|nr:phosphoribosylformylglycinamidine cyclo-ligase [Phycisphaerales bacterium]